MPQLAKTVSHTKRPNAGLFSKLKTLINNGYEKKVDSIGLSVFRIFYSLNLLFEIVKITSFKEIIYDPMPFVRDGEINFYFLLVAWFVAQFMVMIGLYTRYTTVAAYVLCFVCIGTMREFEYHMFFAYLLSNFLMMFIPMNRSLSVDNLIYKKAFGGLPEGWQKVGVINYYAITFFVLAVVYLNSICFKVVSPMWMDGLGLWIPIVTLPIGKADLYWIMDQKWLMYTLNWLTVAFEALFIFLCFDKRFRMPLFIVGVGLHLGIFVFFPIPYFAFGFITLLLLLVPTGFWRRFVSFADEVPGLRFTFLPDYMRNSAAAVGFIVLSLICLNSFYAATGVEVLVRKLGLKTNRAEFYFSRGSHTFAKITGQVIGIDVATVFLNRHFDNFNHIVGIRALNGPLKGQLLPLCKENGTVGPMLEAYTWAYFGFRAIGTDVDMDNLALGLQRGTAFWMGKNGMNPNVDNIQFQILVKKLDVAIRWEAGFRQRMQARPWIPAGTIEWKDGKFTSEIRDVESM